MDSTRTDTIRITAAGSKRSLDTLISAPAAIYNDAPNRIAPLRFKQKQRLTKKNPLFQHTRRQASNNEKCGLQVEGFEIPPHCMTGHTRPWYGDHVEAAGSHKAMDLLADEINKEFERPRTMRYRNDEKKTGPA